MKSELAPGQDFTEFFEGAEAAGQCNESLRKFGHAGLARMHRIDHFEMGETLVINWAAFDFFAHQGLRNDADDLPAGCQAGVGNDTHQADIATAVNQTNVPLGQCRSECRRCGVVKRAMAEFEPQKTQSRFMWIRSG